MHMETKKLLIKNGTLVNSHKSYKSDILIEDGKIKEIAPQINDESIKIIDANNTLNKKGIFCDHFSLVDHTNLFLDTL